MRRITEVIRQHYEHLSPSERRVAGFIIDHLDDLATYNSVELSRQCDTSKATISRLFRRLGYSSFKEAREELRRLRQSGVPMPGPGLQAGGSLIERHFASESQHLQRVMQLAQTPLLAQVTERLADAQRVAVIGFRNSYPVALHLRQQLMQIRPAVQLLPQPGQTLAEELADLTDRDLVVLMAFHRRPAGFKTLLKTLLDRNIPVLLLCEQDSGLVTLKPTWMLELPLNSVSAFDSYALPMSLVSLISNLLLHYQLDHGRARIEQINQLYEQTGELDLNLNVL
ncbi:putative rpiR-family transcriptional regulatory protein [Nitrincola lacisaponensis]|uniref:Putative rpiR-family transcriptional regulatory protein n=1 Tax=Nitrincola lacisaponensis TaxID=267850 RepID=A0A063Y6W4_9GAMM|nr:MurR/RpiR family transcriptional regulator [Nitrincola lacisaponensis]KDE40182.1 putative rpiR-family transcriptional regulatory protein [Nitrincola lacisaponensis]